MAPKFTFASISDGGPIAAISNITLVNPTWTASTPDLPASTTHSVVAFMNGMTDGKTYCSPLGSATTMP
jgi:hypothetical protein